MTWTWIWWTSRCWLDCRYCLWKNGMKGQWFSALCQPNFAFLNAKAKCSSSLMLTRTFWTYIYPVAVPVSTCFGGSKKVKTGHEAHKNLPFLCWNFQIWLNFNAPEISFGAKGGGGEEGQENISLNIPWLDCRYGLWKGWDKRLWFKILKLVEID